MKEEVYGWREKMGCVGGEGGGGLGAGGGVEGYKEHRDTAAKSVDCLDFPRGPVLLMAAILTQADPRGCQGPVYTEGSVRL